MRPKTLLVVVLLTLGAVPRAEAQAPFNPCTDIPALQLVKDPLYVAIQSNDVEKDTTIGVRIFVFAAPQPGSLLDISVPKGDLKRVEGTTNCYRAPMEALKKVLKHDGVTVYRTAARVMHSDDTMSSGMSDMSNPFILGAPQVPIPYAPPVIRVGTQE